MEAAQPVLSERTNPLLRRSSSPSGVAPLQLHADHGAGFYSGGYSFLDTTRSCTTRFSSGSVTSEDSPSPRLLSIKSSSSPDNYSSYEWPDRAAASRSNRYLFDANAQARCAEYLDMMRVEVDAQLGKLKGGVTGLESYALPDNGRVIGGAHLGMSLDVMLIEIDERFNALKLLMGAVFRQAREMLGSVDASASDLQWEHELQLEVFGATIGECVSGLQEELERRLYEQINITNMMSSNWKEAIAQFAAMRQDLSALCKLLLPSVPEAHISSGNRSNRWKFFGKKAKEDRSPRAEDSKSFRKQKSFGAKDVISEKSDFRHLNGRSKEEVISYFKSEISKLKRMHESALQEKTEELFRFKREKGSHSLKNDMEFEPLRKKIPEIISRMDQIISKNTKIPAICMTHDELDERCRLTSRIDALYYENQHLRGLLADKMKDVKALSSQLSEASTELSLQLSSEEELLKQIDKIREAYEDLRIESDVRDGLHKAVTRQLLDDSKDNMDGASMNFSAKLSSLESVISEKDKALCLYNEENHRLKEKLAELERGHFIQSHLEDPEVIKQESTEIVLRDIEVEPHTSPTRSNGHNLQYDELVNLNSSLEIESGVPEETDKKNVDHSNSSSLTKKEQEKQLECILLSIMKLSKDFVEIEKKISVQRTENRSEDLSDHCSHMVRQAVALTKIGLWYEQMLETRRSELQKAEAKVVILGEKINAHLSLLQKIYSTLDRYSPTLHHHPGLLDAFLKTCKLVTDIRSKHQEGDTT
ncbi:unnamed protein product [Urochloa humidicola]